ncbi:MAG: hypothetical protein K2I80_04860 [Ruminococcus sp.]|nr:hypothetical protein [Ruminococcus sp.]
MPEYDVMMHIGNYWATYSVDAWSVADARCRAAERVLNECGFEEYASIDFVRLYEAGADKPLAEYEIR